MEVKMKTITAMKEEVKKIEEELEKLHDYSTSAPVKAAYESFQREKLAEMGRRKPLIEAKEEELENLKYEIEKIQESKKPKWGDRLNKWLHDYQVGVDFSGQLSIVWASPDERFTIVRKGPGTCWAEIGSPRVYVPTEYWLLDTTKGGYKANRNSPIYTFEGRISKKTLEAMKDMAYKVK